jgi:hypothetical protein
MNSVVVPCHSLTVEEVHLQVTDYVKLLYSNNSKNLSGNYITSKRQSGRLQLLMYREEVSHAHRTKKCGEGIKKLIKFLTS